MKHFQIRVMCSINPDKTAQELDRAVKLLKGKREYVLDQPSCWDSWYFPEKNEMYVSLYLSRPNDVWNPWPI